MLLSTCGWAVTASPPTAARVKASRCRAFECLPKQLHEASRLPSSLQPNVPASPPAQARPTCRHQLRRHVLRGTLPL